MYFRESLGVRDNESRLCILQIPIHTAFNIWIYYVSDGNDGLLVIETFVERIYMLYLNLSGSIHPITSIKSAKYNELQLV